MESSASSREAMPAGAGKGGVGVSIALFFVFLAVFALSPVRQVSDAAYSLLVSECLLRDGTVSLDGVVQLPLDPALHPASTDGELPYHLGLHRGRIYYHYPPGTSILSLPFVALSHLFGMSAVFPDGDYHYREERRMQLRLAAILMACLAVVVHRTARMALSARAALAFTAASMLATQVWSTASRGLWSHTWAILLVAVAIHHLVRRETGAGPLRPVLLGTLLCWAYFTRPTMAVGVAAAAVYLALRFRSALLAYCATVAGWLILFVSASWMQYGTLLPPYYRPGKLGTTEFWTGLAGNLVSPSRGLLIFLPYLVIVVLWVVRHRRRSTLMPLAVLGSAATLAHLLIVASFPIWWGGDGYGPRLLTDTVPWLVLVALVAVQARIAATADIGARRNRIETAAAATLLAAAVCMHGVGALSQASNEWNWTPVRVDHEPARVWDWSDPQFLAPFRGDGPDTAAGEVKDAKARVREATSATEPA